MTTIMATRYTCLEQEEEAGLGLVHRPGSDEDAAVLVEGVATGNDCLDVALKTLLLVEDEVLSAHQDATCSMGSELCGHWGPQGLCQRHRLSAGGHLSVKLDTPGDLRTGKHHFKAHSRNNT